MVEWTLCWFEFGVMTTAWQFSSSCIRTAHNVPLLHPISTAVVSHLQKLRRQKNANSSTERNNGSLCGSAELYFALSAACFFYSSAFVPALSDAAELNVPAVRWLSENRFVEVKPNCCCRYKGCVLIPLISLLLNWFLFSDLRNKFRKLKCCLLGVGTY